MKRLIARIIICLAPVWATAFELYGKPEQGGVIFGRAAAPDDKITLDGREIEVGPDGLFVIGFDRDAKSEYVITYQDSPMVLEIAPRKWEEQHLKLSKVATSYDLPRIKTENRILNEARRNVYITAAPCFEKPLEGRISGNFGVSRVINGQTSNYHGGTDFAAPTGTPVRSIGAGIVTLAYPDTFFGGNTVIVSHGAGLFSVYMHLDKILSQTGDEVSRDTVIGLVGATGRVTGPHLHLTTYWFDSKIDPMTLFEVLACQ